jgi:LysR family hydrogen peroxide-inducible transcriptional activator
VKPNVVFESGQFASILALVAAGVGVSIVPEMAVQAVSGCVYVPLQNRGASRRIGVVRIRQHFQTRAQQIFVNYLVQRSMSANEMVKSAIVGVPEFTKD